MKAVIYALGLLLALIICAEPFNCQNEDPYLAFAEVMPEPIGGMKSIYALIKYPGSARQKSVEGKVYALALINEEGAVDEVKIIKSLEAGCDNEVVKALSNSKFFPGKHGGKAVKVKLTLKIEFKLS